MGRVKELGDMTGKVVIVTGANAGIGKETAVGLARLGATVVMAARDQAKGEAALTEIRERAGAGAQVELASLDLASFPSIREFAERFGERHQRLDVLVNNAGLMMAHRVETPHGFETMFGVNHVGHFVLTEALRGSLEATPGSRVVVVSSIAHRWAVRGLPKDDLAATKRFNQYVRYGQSKLANLLFAAELARRLHGTGVTANALHPGSVNSHFASSGDTGVMGWFMRVFGRFVLKSPEAGAKLSIALAASPDPRVTGASGAYFSRGLPRRPSKHGRDPELARWLWDETERLVAAVPTP